MGLGLASRRGQIRPQGRQRPQAGCSRQAQAHKRLAQAHKRLALAHGTRRKCRLGRREAQQEKAQATWMMTLPWPAWRGRSQQPSCQACSAA